MKAPLFLFLFHFVCFNTLKAQSKNEQLQHFQDKIENTNNGDTILYYLELQGDLLKNTEDYIRRGDIEMEIGDYSNFDGLLAEKHYMKAGAYYLLVADSAKYAKSLDSTGGAKLRQDEYNSALVYYDSAIALSNHLGLTDQLIKSHSSKADVYVYLSDYNKALEELNMAKKLALRNEDDKSDLIKIYRTESHILLNTKEYDKAIALVNKIVDYYKEINSPRKIVMWSNNLAKIHSECRCGEKEDRQKLLNEAIRYAEESNFLYGKAYAYMHMARLHMEFKELDKSHIYLRKVEKMLPNIGKKQFQAWVYEVYGHFWLQKKDYKKSIAYEKKVLEIWTELKSPHGQGLSSKKLSKLYIKINDYKEAYYHYESSQIQKDSLLNKEKIERYKELEMTADFEKKMYADSLRIVQEKELTALRFEQEIAAEKQSKTLLYFVLIIISMGGFGFYWAFRKKKEQAIVLDAKNKQIAEALEDKQLLLKEIHHRVKNNFQVVSSLLELQTQGIEDEKALGLAKEGQNRIKAMALIHEKLYRTESGLIDFDEFILLLVKELTGLYENLEKVNVKVNSKGVQFDLDTAIPLGLIVNELITNSFKYAFSKDKINELSVSINKADNDHYRLVVSDNGPGVFLNTEIRKIKSIGLFLVYRLTRQLKGKIELTNKGGARFDLLFKHIDARHSID